MEKDKRIKIYGGVAKEKKVQTWSFVVKVNFYLMLSHTHTLIAGSLLLLWQHANCVNEEMIDCHKHFLFGL